MLDNGPRADAEQVDVAAILEGLRAEVRARRLALGQSEPSPLERDLQRSLDEIELHRVVSAHWPLIGKTAPQRAIALVNKLVRRYLRWYINPIVEQQNAYNDAVARTLRLLAEAYAELGEQIGENQEPRTRISDTDTRRHGEPRPGALWANQEPGAENREPGAESRPIDDQPHLYGEASVPALTEEKIAISNLQFPISVLQAQVYERGAAEPPARFPDLELRALEPHLRLREQVSAHWPLPAATLAQRAIALVNKLVRRYLRWYINPIVEQQNAANAAISAALLAAIRLDAERRAQVAARRAKRAGERVSG